MNKTAVVFGATGLVGKEVVSQLLCSDVYSNVVIVVRKEISVSDPKLDQIVLSDFSQLNKLSDKLIADTFFCCVGTTMKRAGSKENFRMVDLAIPQKIARLAEKLSIPNFVVISSVGANMNSSNFYLSTKGEMEDSVREIYRGNLKIVHPSLLMGKREEFRSGEKTANVLMKIFGWLLVGPLSRYKAIHAKEVAGAMIALASYPVGKVVYESHELKKINYYKKEEASD